MGSVSSGRVVVSCSDERHARRNHHTCQVRTIRKCIRPDVLYAFGDDNLRQTVATAEGMVRDTLHPAGDDGTPQPATVGERIFPDALHAGRQHREVGEACAVIEHMITDTCHAVGYRDRRQPLAVVEYILPDARHTIQDRDVRNALVRGREDCGKPGRK